MTQDNTRRKGLFTFSSLVAATTLVALGLTAPAYADKPDAPPGQAKKAQSSTQSHGHDSGSASTGGSTKPDQGRGQASSHQTSGTAGTSRDVHSPQPRSNADDNGGGANHTGPYDSTRDGSPSGNGNGKGKATGKPCAGCVGKADNKNPKGQYPNGSDHNAGYECDRNHGIGRTNPAHTGCRTQTTPPEECTDNPVTTMDECHPSSPGECVDNPATPADECGTTPPGECVDIPGTPMDECGQSGPPSCVDIPGTPMDECHPSSPGVCVDNPATPADECGQVSPPGTPETPGGNTPGGNTPGGNTPDTTTDRTPGTPPGTNAGPAPAVSTTTPAPQSALPNTGAPSGALLAGVAGLLLVLAGTGVVATRRNNG